MLNDRNKVDIRIPLSRRGRYIRLDDTGDSLSANG